MTDSKVCKDNIDFRKLNCVCAVILVILPDLIGRKKGKRCNKEAVARERERNRIERIRKKSKKKSWSQLHWREILEKLRRAKNAVKHLPNRHNTHIFNIRHRVYMVANKLIKTKSPAYLLSEYTSTSNKETGETNISDAPKDALTCGLQLAFISLALIYLNVSMLCYFLNINTNVKCNTVKCNAMNLPVDDVASVSEDNRVVRIEYISPPQLGGGRKPKPKKVFRGKSSHEMNSRKQLTLERVNELISEANCGISLRNVNTDVEQEKSNAGYWEYINANNCTVEFTAVGSDIIHTIRLEHLLARGFPVTLSQKESHFLTTERLTDIIDSSGYIMKIDNIETDSTNTCNYQVENGPWPYYDSAKCKVHYSFEDGTTHSMFLNSLLDRGFTIPSHLIKKTYKYYSFLRFKQYCKKSPYASVETVEGNEEIYLNMLKSVSLYYEMHPDYVKSENLKEYEGPQNFADLTNSKKRLYYGIGWYKLYRFLDMKTIIEERKGLSASLNFAADPTTSDIEESLFEDMLWEVNDKISHNYAVRNQGKIELYSGPQCYEDRFIKNKVEYNVNFRAKKAHQQPESNETDQMTVEKSKLLEDMSDIYIRACSVCTEARILGKRAATKYHNALYTYEGVTNTVIFKCTNLVNTECSKNPDYKIVNFDDYIVGEKYIALTDEHGCISGLQLELLDKQADGSFDASVKSTFGCDTSPCHLLKNKSIALRKINVNTTKTGQRTQQGRVVDNDFCTVELVLISCLIEKPHQAKCCRPFLYPIPTNPDNHNIFLESDELTKVKKLHSVYNAMKILTCIKCGRSSPGLEEPKSIDIPVHGEMVKMTQTDPLIDILKGSEVIKASDLVIDQQFSNTDDHISTAKSLTGICTKCSEFYEISGENKVVRKEPIRIQQDNNILTIAKINPWGPENLMSTNIFLHHQNLNYRVKAQAFENFVDTLSLIEIMICSPTLVHMILIRTRSTLMPVQRHGTIAFPLITKPMNKDWTASALPWSDFKHLPFVVIVRKDNDAVLQQARINMENIYKMRDFMTYETTCPITGDVRPFYRFAQEGWCPFTMEQMDKLRNEIDHEAGPRQGIPHNLREFTVEQLADKSKRLLTFKEFDHWMNQREAISQHIWAEYLSLDEHCQSQDSNKTHKNLWNLVAESIKDDETIEITEEHPLESFMTIEVLAKYALKKHWLVATYVNDSDDPLKDLIYGIATEFENASRLYSNDCCEDGIIGQVQSCPDGNPQDILTNGLKKTALAAFATEPDRSNPVDEWSPGYFQRAFPGVFLSGDGDPFQLRHECIRNKSGWDKNYLKWISMQPRAQHNAVLQFTINNILKRMSALNAANIIIKDPKINLEEITKKQFVENTKEAEKISTVVMQHKGNVIDSPAFWQNELHKEIGISRHLESVTLRKDDKKHPKKYPILGSIFTTSAIPYVDAPYIHNLIPNENPLQGDLPNLHEREKLQRRSNVLKYGQVVDFMSSFVGELQTKYISLERAKSKDYIKRDEWGGNLNPHFHSILYSVLLGELVVKLETELTDYLKGLCDLHSTNIDTDFKKEVEERVIQKWEECQQRVIEFYRNQYSNWNPGKTAEGEPTYAYSEEPIQISKLDMAVVIDEALSSGDFSKLDDIFVKICFSSLCHISHTGKNNRPSKRDYCYTKVKKVDKKRTQAKRVVNKKAKAVTRYYAACKRRKPQELRGSAAIYKDPHDKKKIQLSFDCNDGFFNGCDEIKVLNVLGNCDDKAIVPPSFMRPPKITWENGIPTLSFFTCSGIDHLEYLLKYVLKDSLPPKTNVEQLSLVLEDLNDDAILDPKSVRKVYCQDGLDRSTSLPNAIHVNQGRPLTQRSTRVTDVNVKGTTTLTKDYNEEEHGEFGYFSSKTKIFDMRFDAIDEEHQKYFNETPISMREFFEFYNYTKKMVGGKQMLQLTKRPLYSNVDGKYCATRSTPTLKVKNANPHSKYFSETAKHLVTYYKKYDKKISESIPTFANDDEKAAYWMQQLKENFPDGEGYPDPFVKRILQHYAKHNEDEDSSDTSVDMSSTSADNDSDTSSDDDADDDLKGKREREKYYQEIPDRFQNLPTQKKSHKKTTDADNAENLLDDPVINANPSGMDPHAWCNGRKFTSQDEAKFIRHVAEVKNVKGTFRQTLQHATLNQRQRLSVDIVTDWVKDVINSQKNNLPYPKPLRLFTIGIPGAGKTFAFKYLVGKLMDMLGETEWQSKVAFVTATGAAAYHMSYGATTVHSKFCIKIDEVGKELKDDPLLQFIEKLGNDLLLIVVDEISTLQRQLFSAFIKRLGQAGYDLNKLGFVFLGDPAQTLPIGDNPVWSTNSKKEDGKEECCPESLNGIAAFRSLMGMKPKSMVKGYAAYNKLLNDKRNSEQYRKKLEEAHAVYMNNVYDGDYEAVYLNESNRKTNSKESDEWTGNFIPRVRYGNFSDEDIKYLKKSTATQQETKNNPDWKKKTIMCAKHYFSDINPHDINVDTLNAQNLLEYGKDNDAPVVYIHSQHWPVSREKHLRSQSGKMFKNIPPMLGLAPGIKLMLTENINPTVGLFNGAICTFVGVIYIPQCISVKVEEKSLPSIALESAITKAPFEVQVSGRSVYIPQGSEVKVDGDNVECSNVDQIPTGTVVEFHLAQTFPSLPDYLVVEVENFSSTTGGITLFEDMPEFKNCTLIPAKKVLKETKPGEKQSYDVRKGFPVELAAAYTTYKGIGATHEKSVWMMRKLVDKPGCAYVGLTRVREPKDIYIPESEFPSTLDFRLQRLKPVVLECANLERNVRIKCARQEISGKLSVEQNQMADIIVNCWRDFITDPAKMISGTDIDLDAFMHVVTLLKETDVFLLLKPTPMLSVAEYKLLNDHKNSRKKHRSNTTPHTPYTKKTPTKPRENTKRPRNDPTSMPAPKRKPPQNRVPVTKVQVPQQNIVTDVLPRFRNVSENVCWLNSLMHIILVMFRHLQHTDMGIQGNETFFWAFVEDIVRNYTTHETDFYRPQIKIGNITWSLRGLFSDIIGDPTANSQLQQDSVEYLRRFLTAQNKLTNYHVIHTNRHVCSTCNHVVYADQALDTFLAYRVKKGQPIDLSLALTEDTHINDRICDQCGIVQMFRVKDHLVSTSEMLLISLERWIQTITADHTRHYEYISTSVATLNNIQVVTDDNGLLFYDVVAAISHYPTVNTDPNSGHYLAHIKVGDQWYKANDSSVERVTNGPDKPRLLLLKKSQTMNPEE